MAEVSERPRGGGARRPAAEYRDLRQSNSRLGADWAEPTRPATISARA